MSRDEKIREILRDNCTLTNVNNYAALIMDKGKADCLNDLIVALSTLYSPVVDKGKLKKVIWEFGSQRRMKHKEGFCNIPNHKDNELVNKLTHTIAQKKSLWFK